MLEVVESKLGVQTIILGQVVCSDAASQLLHSA